MQVSQQRRHLRVVEASGKPRHQSPTHQNILPHRRVRSWYAAWQRLVLEHAMQVRRNFLQCHVIVLVAMRAPHLVKVLPFRFLRGQLRR